MTNDNVIELLAKLTVMLTEADTLKTQYNDGLLGALEFSREYYGRGLNIGLVTRQLLSYMLTRDFVDSTAIYDLFQESVDSDSREIMPLSMRALQAHVEMIHGRSIND